jgi:hypothetical protein
MLTGHDWAAPEQTAAVRDAGVPRYDGQSPPISRAVDGELRNVSAEQVAALSAAKQRYETERSMNLVEAGAGQLDPTFDVTPEKEEP